MGYIKCQTESWVQRVWTESPLSVTGLFLSFFLASLLGGSGGERSVQGGEELVFGLRGPWTHILSLSTAATPPPTSTSPPPFSPRRSVAALNLKGIPLLPRLPNEEWHASGGSDLVWNRALASPVLSPIIDCGGSHRVTAMRAPYTQEALLPNRGGCCRAGGSKGRCNSMESWGPNCLYSWAAWLILEENETL